MLLTWFSPSKAVLPRTTKALDIQHSLNQIAHLPSLSDTAIRAIALANDANATLADYASLIKRDGGLATGILKLANSSLFRGNTPVTDIHQAVLRLGLRMCNQLITSVGMRGLFKAAKPRTLERCEILWRHGFFTACLAGQVSHFLELGYQGEEFTAALLHDLGRTFITIAMPQAADEIDPLDFLEDDQRIAHERQKLDVDHAELGARYCERHGLPPAIIECNRYHHSPMTAMANRCEHRNLIALVALADQVANQAQRTHQIRDYAITSNIGYKALALGWQGRKLTALGEQLPHLVVSALRTTRAMLKSQLV